jgi:hypothetical protein
MNPAPAEAGRNSRSVAVSSQLEEVVYERPLHFYISEKEN